MNLARLLVTGAMVKLVNAKFDDLIVGYRIFVGGKEAIIEEVISSLRPPC